MYEPQPWLNHKLQYIEAMARVLSAPRVGSAHAAAHVSALWVRAAAWTREGNLTFYVGAAGSKFRRSRTATLEASHAARHDDLEQMSVRSVDLGARLLKLRETTALLVVKMDVESAEYALVPHLLVPRLAKDPNPHRSFRLFIPRC